MRKEVIWVRWRTSVCTAEWLIVWLRVVEMKMVPRTHFRSTFYPVLMTLSLWPPSFCVCHEACLQRLRGALKQADVASPSFLFDFTKILLIDSKLNINLQVTLYSYCSTSVPIFFTVCYFLWFFFSNFRKNALWLGHVLPFIHLAVCFFLLTVEPVWSTFRGMVNWPTRYCVFSTLILRTLDS